MQRRKAIPFPAQAALALLLSPAGASLLFAGPPSPGVVPAPRSWAPSPGLFRLVQGAPLVLDASAPPSFEEPGRLFARDLGRLLGSPCSLERGLSRGGTIFLAREASLGKEAYTISTRSSGVTIRAGGPAGLFYASRTILQILLSRGDGALPCGTIRDAPAWPIRSILLDVGRKFLPPDELEDWIRMVSWVRMNEIHLHLNDNSWGRYPGYRLESRAFPRLPSRDGFYTWKEIREIQAFARARGVHIVPEIDSPGHALAFTTLRPDLAHPDLDKPAFGLAYLDLRKPETLAFMKRVFDEVAPLFESPFFHIGTDEYRLGLVRDKKERARLGRLFRRYINECARYLERKHHKIVRIWSGYEHMPGTTEPDKSIWIDMWATSDALDKSRAGYKFINSSHFYTYIVPGMPYYGVNDRFLYEKWTPLVFRLKDPKGVLKPGAPGLMGGKLHVWNDGGPTGYTWNEIARLTWPSLMTISEKLWGTKGSPGFDAFRARAARVARPLGVTLLDRKAQAGPGGLVWRLEKKPLWFIANSHYPLDLPGKPGNLEYPWTATFTVERHTDAGGDEVLLSSDLAAFYLDLAWKKKNRKSGRETTLRGVACVRAKQAPGPDPLHSFNPDVIVFDYQVPLKKKVRLTFIGERKKTSLYADGRLVGTRRIQMVCPLERLGASRPESFQGRLLEGAIWNRAPWKALGGWTPADLGKGFEILEWKVEEIPPDGKVRIEFRYEGGRNGLDIRWAALWKDGKELARDRHPGFTGNMDRDPSYLLQVPGRVPEGPFVLRALVQGSGGKDSRGRVFLWDLPGGP